MRLSTDSDIWVSRLLDHGVLALSYTRELYQLSRWDATNLVQTGKLENSNERDGFIWKDQGSWYGDDFVVDKIFMKEVIESVVELVEIIISLHIDLVHVRHTDWIEDQPERERESERQVEQVKDQRLTNERILQRIFDNSNNLRSQFDLQKAH